MVVKDNEKCTGNRFCTKSTFSVVEPHSCANAGASSAGNNPHQESDTLGAEATHGYEDVVLKEQLQFFLKGLLGQLLFDELLLFLFRQTTTTNPMCFMKVQRVEDCSQINTIALSVAQNAVALHRAPAAFGAVNAEISF